MKINLAFLKVFSIAFSIIIMSSIAKATYMPDFQALGYSLYEGNIPESLKIEGLKLNNDAKYDKKHMSMWVLPDHTDRHQRTVGQIVIDGKWLQCDLLRQGKAITNTSPNSAKITPYLYNCENNDFIKSKTILAQDAVPYIGKFAIISGTVFSTYQSSKNFYVNFDKDWKTDFSLMISNKILKKCPPTFTKKLVTGQKLRIRGWLEKYNGPVIKLTHPEQIEFLED